MKRIAGICFVFLLLTGASKNKMNNEYKYDYGINPFKFCTFCGKPAHSRPTIDVLMDARICSDGHRMVIPKKMIRAKDWQGDWKKLRVKNENDQEIIRVWLSDINYREHLQNQFAELLRLLYEQASGTYGDNKQPGSGNAYQYCPICAKPLMAAKIDMGGSWAHPVKCANEHLFFSRSGLSYRDAHNSEIEIHFEFNPVVLSKVFPNDNLTEKNAHFFLPDQLVPIFLASQSASEKETT